MDADGHRWTQMNTDKMQFSAQMYVNQVFREITDYLFLEAVLKISEITLIEAKNPRGRDRLQPVLTKIAPSDNDQ